MEASSQSPFDHPALAPAGGVTGTDGATTGPGMLGGTAAEPLPWTAVHSRVNVVSISGVFFVVAVNFDCSVLYKYNSVRCTRFRN